MTDLREHENDTDELLKQPLDARWKSSRWVLFLLMSFLFTSCKPAAKLNQHMVSDEMCHLHDDLDLDEELNEASLRCNTSNAHRKPVLYAHYLARALSEEICVDDLVNDSRGAIHCAPGPVLLADGNSIDGSDQEWILSSFPDYFAWHLDGKNSVDEMIYIANASGIPIKSQSIKLENDRESTLVLFPKTSLTPNTRYYLYLVRSTANATQRWIQPIMTTANNDGFGHVK